VRPRRNARRRAKPTCSRNSAHGSAPIRRTTWRGRWRSFRFEFQGAPDASWSDLKRSYAQEFARPGGVGWVPRWDEIRVSGEIAAALSLWQGFVTKADGTKELRATNRSVDVLRRGVDCRWRIFRSLTYPVKPSPAAK